MKAAICSDIVAMPSLPDPKCLSFAPLYLPPPCGEAVVRTSPEYSLWMTIASVGHRRRHRSQRMHSSSCASTTPASPLLPSTMLTGQTAIHAVQGCPVQQHAPPT